MEAYWPFGNGGADDSKYVPYAFVDGMAFNDPTWGTQTIVTTNGIATGCDLWSGANVGGLRAQTRDDLHKIRLTRAAKVYVVWRGPVSQVPTWLNGSAYTYEGDVSGIWSPGKAAAPWPVYSRVVSAGDSYYGSSWSSGTTPVGTRDLPWFVLCEANGTPSPPPAVPSGVAVPAPNQACPAWVHDQHMTGGLRTWHAQIDPIYWCYYQHEHGSDPKYYDANWTPVFGQVGQIAGMSENHWGNKIYVFDRGDYRYGIQVHMGTTGVGRVCQQFHEVQFQVKRISSGAEVVSLRFIGNFGVAVENETSVRLTPSACPNQGTTHIGNGVRMIPVVNGGGPAGATKYEPWRLDCTYVVLGCLSNDFIVNAPGAVTACLDITCNTPVDLGQAGTERFVTLNNLRIAWSAPMGADGHFCTDPLGEAWLACDAPTAVAQYIEPSLVLQHGDQPHLSDVQGWSLPFEFNVNTGFDAERENSIPVGGPN